MKAPGQQPFKFVLGIGMPPVLWASVLGMKNANAVAALLESARHIL
jgi:hypothetical protein